ncbi:ferritin-like domain-containing protein [Roseateles sp.]|uniref:ferritin-like domain-containing protein n=1 Tax=Roseateles sp. TaxID=1971397 RepID=UPI0031CFC8F9
MELRTRALQVLLIADPQAKAAAARELHAAATAMTAMTGTPSASLAVDGAPITPSPECGTSPALAPEVRLDTSAILVPEIEPPGRPARPRLVAALQVASRSPYTPEGRAALLHAIAHIEFNAINLALDAVWRFPDMPRAYYLDWLRVAAEEALHFTLLDEHLRGLGRAYGDFDAHDGLWTMAMRTAGDVLARMALVPRTLEARGLDATPPLQAKFAKAGDARAVEILGVILRDEVGHVRIGNHWYRHLCRERGLDPVALYPELVERHEAPKLRPPFNLEARGAAGFSDEELAYLRS